MERVKLSSWDGWAEWSWQLSIKDAFDLTGGKGKHSKESNGMSIVLEAGKKLGDGKEARRPLWLRVCHGSYSGVRWVKNE